MRPDWKREQIPESIIEVPVVVPAETSFLVGY
jgi:hypothetical protein